MSFDAIRWGEVTPPMRMRIGGLFRSCIPTGQQGPDGQGGDKRGDTFSDGDEGVWNSSRLQEVRNTGSTSFQIQSQNSIP